MSHRLTCSGIHKVGYPKGREDLRHKNTSLADKFEVGIFIYFVLRAFYDN